MTPPSSNPQQSLRRRPTVLLVKAPCYSDSLSPPLGLGYLAAHLRDIARVRIVDAVMGPANLGDFATLVAREQPDIIGFSVVTFAAAASRAWMLAARARAPRALIVLAEALGIDSRALIVAGGPHPSAMPRDYLTQCGADLDLILAGESEFSFRKLVELVAAGELRPNQPDAARYIDGAHALKGDELIASHESQAQNIDDYGMPAWELIDPRNYPHSPHGAFARAFPVAPIVTSRGCPYACGFCTVPYLVGRKMRYRSPELIVEELQLLRDRSGLREFQIVDDNFTIRRDHTIKVCEAIIKNNLVMPWSTPNGVRVDALDDEVLDAMQAAGCYSISLGIESGSEAVLKRMVKHLDLNIVPGTIERIRRRGMEANGFFILGYPGETPEEAELTLRYARSLPLTRANFSVFTPLPGTPEFDILSDEEKARIGGDGSFFGQVKYVSPEYTPEQLKDLQRRGILMFYARPRQAYRLARAIRTPQTAYYVARRALAWLGSVGA